MSKQERALKAYQKAWKPAGDVQVKVERYKGDIELQFGIARMLAEGWEIQTQSTRKQAYSMVTGVFTSNQIHTVTYVKSALPARPD